MFSSVLASAHIARSAVLRLWSLLLVGGVAACGTVLLFVYTPVTPWARAWLMGLLVVYFGRTAFRLLYTHQALKQHRLEVLFLEHACTTEALARCMSQRSQLWGRSCILQGLLAVSAAPPAHLLSTKAKKRHLARRFHRALSPLRRPRLNLDQALPLILLGSWFALAPLEAVDARYLPVKIGLVAGTLGLLAEVGCTALQWRHADALKQFERTLTAWTLAEVLATPPVERPYTHRLLYRAPSWFRTRGDSTAPPALTHLTTSTTARPTSSSSSPTLSTGSDTLPSGLLTSPSDASPPPSFT